MIKKIIYIAIITSIVLTAFLVSNSDARQVPFNQSKNKVFKIAGDSNFPPYEYIDENGNFTGFNVDIMRAIALATGADIQFYPMEWNEACDKLKNGEVDIIEGMKYTKDRDKIYDFSDAYLENSQSIFVLSGTEDINSFEDLRYKKVVVQQGDVAVLNLKVLDGVDIIYTSDQEQAINKLLKREVDAYIGNTLTGIYFLNKNGSKDEISIVGKALNITKYSIAVKEGDTETLNIINTGLKQIMKDDTYDKIYRKWFGQYVYSPVWQIKKLLFLALTVILIFTIVVLIFYKWNSSLKKEVDRQTYKINEANRILIKKNDRIKQERDFREEILNNIFSGVVTINRYGIITFTNKLAESILNVKSSSLLNKNYEDTLIKKIFLPDGLHQKTGKKEFITDDRKKYLNYKISLLSSSDKEMNETIIIFQDITEEKLMQETIRTKDKLHSLGNLVSSIAHEIRNPLTSIKTYAELIPKKYDNPKFRVMVSKDIPYEIDRLNTMINDLLEYSRPRKPFKERILLCDAIDSVLVLLRSKTEKADIKVFNEVGKDTYIFIDKNHFRQVLINILLNAIESMDKYDKKIIISSYIKDNKVYLSISDNGCGIASESIDKIFNPFYTTKPSGTGIGLFVSYQLMSENNGQIKVDSTPGEGTTFSIEFEKTEVDTFAQTFDS